MNGNPSDNNQENPLLLKQFNERNPAALEEVYSILYDDLHRYARMLYYDTGVDACDAVHDTFIKIWSDRRQHFDKLINLKAFILVSLKNSFRNHVTREKYREKQLKGYMDDDYFVVQIAEIEVTTFISQALDFLPEESGKVIKLALDGWEIKDIAEKLNKKPSTVYNQRREAIRILREKLPKDQLLILLILLDQIR